MHDSHDMRFGHVSPAATHINPDVSHIGSCRSWAPPRVHTCNPCRALTPGAVQAGATAVVPETLEPGLQLASAVLSQLNMPPDDVQEAIQNFRRNHLMELQARPACIPAVVLEHMQRA